MTSRSVIRRATRAPSPSAESPHHKAIAERLVRADENFLETLMARGQISRADAEKVFEVYKRRKVVTRDAVAGRYSVKHGAFLDREVILRALSEANAGRAAGKKKAAAPVPPAAPKPPPTPSELLERTLASLIIDFDPSEPISSVKVDPNDMTSFENGLYAREDSFFDLNYFFTFHHPRVATAKTVYRIGLDKLKREIESDGKLAGLDPEIVKGALALLSRRDAVNTIICAARPAVENWLHASSWSVRDRWDMSANDRLKFYDASKDYERTSYTATRARDGKVVELAEYPTVYVQYDFRDIGSEVGTMKVEDGALVIPIYTRYVLEHRKWSFDSEEISY